MFGAPTELPEVAPEDMFTQVDFTTTMTVISYCYDSDHRLRVVVHTKCHLQPDQQVQAVSVVFPRS